MPRGARRAKPETGGDGARARVVTATIETLKREGYAGTSARAIAATGGFAQGVVFYHFGSMTDVLLAALDETSRVRLTRYEHAVGEAATLPELVDAAATVFREDLEAGHVKVLAELIAAASSVPGFGAEINRRIEPWITFTEDAVTRVLGTSAVGAVVPARDAAFAIVALFLGIEMLTQLDGDASGAHALFDAAARLAQLLAPFFGASERSSS